MKRALRFRLNRSLFEITEREEILALDWIRGEQRLIGTKEGCREGDCGACMVLLGEQTPAGPQWKAALSCLLALGEMDGKHVITIEGIGSGGLTPVMEAMLDEGASQCGFCSPGFVVSLTAYLIGGGKITQEGAIRAVEGNLCRCTGYGSIQRAAARLVEQFGNLPDSLPERIAELSRAGVIPKEVADLMIDIPAPAGSVGDNMPPAGTEALTLGGGTDHFVRNPDPDAAPHGAGYGAVAFSDRDPALRRIIRSDDTIQLGASVSIQEFFESSIIREAFPGIEQNEPGFASLPIRTRATLAGNITNASPIGDMTAILLALRTTVRIRKRDESRSTAGQSREVPLEKYFLSYRRTALEPGEYVETLIIPQPQLPQSTPHGRLCFNFEKVAKRKHLDIASANSACLALVDGEGAIQEMTLSAGGVGPVPMRLPATEQYLQGKRVDGEAARRAAEIAAEECAPIDDVRGAAAYRRTLLGRFIWAHLMRLVPELDLAKELLR